MMRRPAMFTALLMAMVLVIQTFSPLYATIRRVEACDLSNEHRALNCHEASLGILWVYLVLNDASTDAAPSASGTEITAAQHDDDEDIVLVKRKRAVLQSRVSVKPYLVARQVIENTEPPLPSLILNRVVSSTPVGVAVDGYSSLSTGLSPPFPVA